MDNEELYKQLKRLEQENKELKAENTRLKEGKDFLAMSIIELAAENEQLKKENEKLLHQKNTMTARYGITYTTLQEIKEIVEKGQWNFAGVTEKQILQKISEVME